LRKLGSTIIAMIAAGLMPPIDHPAVAVGKKELVHELPVIADAAVRNDCSFNDYLLLIAIRVQEDGRAGCEFGVTHQKAWETDLNTQAGWAAKTVHNQHKRFGDDRVTHGYVLSLADRYCPVECDPEGNKHWKENVWKFYSQLRSDLCQKKPKPKKEKDRR